MSTKAFQFLLPKKTYEEFFILFPGYGDRSRVLQRIVGLLVDKGSKNPDLVKDILEPLREKDG